MLDQQVICATTRTRTLTGAEKVTANGRATNLECADGGGALGVLEFLQAMNPKRRRTALAAALQISL